MSKVEVNMALSSPNPLHILRQIYPPSSIIHIGAGTGFGAMHIWRDWDLPSALLVDADGTRLEWAMQLASTHPSWYAEAALLSANGADHPYYSATNPAEDGLIPPESFGAIWPNLRTSTLATRATESLAALLDRIGDDRLSQGDGRWLIIDCMPALEILRGAADQIGNWDVVWARVLLRSVDPVPDAANVAHVQAYLSQFGLHCVHIFEGNHPDIGEAVFVRDRQQQLTAITAKLCALRAGLEGRTDVEATRPTTPEAELINLIQVVEHQTRRLGEQAAQLDEMNLQLADQARATNNVALEEMLSQQAEVHRKTQEDVLALHQAIDKEITKLAAMTHERDQLEALQKGGKEKERIWLEERAALLLQLDEHRQRPAPIDPAEFSALAENFEKLQATSKSNEDHISQLLEEKSELVRRIDRQATEQAEFHRKTQDENLALHQAIDKEISKLTAMTHERDQLAALQKDSQEKERTWLEERTSLLLELDEHRQRPAPIDPAEFSALAENFEKLQAKSKSNADHIGQLVDEKSELVRRMDKQATEIQMLAEQNQQVREDISTFIDRNRSLVADNATLTERWQRLQAECAAITVRNQGLATEIETLQGLCRNLTDEQAALRRGEREQVQQIAAYRSELDVLRAEKASQANLLAQQLQAIAERDVRQRLLEDEMTKAEAQVAFIKDVLFSRVGDVS